MALDQIWIVGFTGHRPSDAPGRSAADMMACKPVMREILQDLNARAAQQGGHIEILTSLAAGSDLELAETATELAIPVHIILPMPLAQFEQDFAGDPESWSRVMKFVTAATADVDAVTIRVSQGSSQRPDCYHETNVQILQCCDLLLALWNSLPEEGIGGTAEAVAHARRGIIPLIVIDPRTREVSSESGAANWPKADPLVTSLNKHLGDSETSAKAIFDQLDNTATLGGKRFRGRLVTAMALHFAAALLAATTASFTPVMLNSANSVTEPSAEHANDSEDPDASVVPADPKVNDTDHTHTGHSDPILPKIMTAFELFLVSLAWYIMWVAHHGDLHSLWRKSRFATEVARGLIDTSRLLDPLDPLLVRHAPEWRRFSVSFALNAYRSTPTDLSVEERKARYIKDRLNYQVENHFTKKLGPAKLLASRLSAIAKFASYSAPIFIFIALLAKVLDVKHLASSNYLLAGIIFWLPVVLPLLAGSAISFLVATDSARRAERYQLMIERLNLANQNLIGLKSDAAVSRAVAVAEDIMIDELIEWYVASKNVGH